MSRVCIFVVLLISMLLYSNVNASTIDLKITNLDRVKSTLYIGIYDNKDSFPTQGKQYLGKTVKLDGNNASIDTIFTDVPSGIYAISVFQDKNNNHKLDTNWFGIPTEPYGFSNNISRPNFDKASFELSNDQIKKLTIAL